MSSSDPEAEFRDAMLVRSQSPTAENLMRQAIQHTLKDLLEGGHLYRNKTVALTSILNLANAQFPAADLEDEFTHRPWIPYSHNRGFTAGEEQILKNARGTDHLNTPARERRLHFVIPTLSTWCATCKSHELHDSIPHIESSPYHLNPHEIRDVVGTQKFIFNYRCHRCRGELLTFMVRREKLKVQLCGRSRPYFPDIPSDLPKALQPIYADAIGAAMCGDLSGAFYHVRTMLEHHMKATCGIRMDEQLAGSDLCERYNRQIDSAVTQRASLSREFSRCSEYLHNRTGTLDDFEEIRKRVLAHFRLIKTLESLA